MNRSLLGCVVAGICALSISVSAQQQPAAQQQDQPSTAPSAQAEEANVTVEGCLVREQDVPGRQPNVAERAGVMEDYILTHAKVTKGSAPQAQAAEARPDQPVGTAGTLAPMYDVKGLADDRLKALVGKRVQVEGTFADETKGTAAGATEDLVDIRGTTIREVSGECPPK
jgi:hypothetical protein